VPTLLIIALLVIPYFNINIEASGLFLKDRTKRLRLFYLAALGMLVFLLAFHVYVAVGPTVIVALAMIVAANSTPIRLHGSVAIWPGSRCLLGYDWFLFELIVLTAVGTWFRGPGWSWFCHGGVKCNPLERFSLCVARALRDPVRAFGVVSLGLLLALAIAPAKEHFSQWHSYQRHYLALIHDRGDAVSLRRRFLPGFIRSGCRTWVLSTAAPRATWD